MTSSTASQLLVAEESLGTSPRYIAYGELPIDSNRRARAPTTPAFRHLKFAIYLGGHARRSALISTTAPLPFTGDRQEASIPFGQGRLLFVDSPAGPIGGGALPVLPWIIAGTGAVLVIGAVVAAERLTRRRHLAEKLASENHRLYSEQRTLAQHLQRALLPAVLPAFDGLETAARYVPGDPATDIGGDWYDVIRCDEDSAMFVVNDVSGRGIPAANTMASLHFAIRAYAAQGDSATEILRKLDGLLDIARDGHFATVLLGHIDISGHHLTFVRAGHLPPLLVSMQDGSLGATFLEARSGSPIGVEQPSAYVPVSVAVPPGARLLAYTDGLVERRGEDLDAGLERLRQVALGRSDAGGDALDRIIATLTGGKGGDDIALLELRWVN